MTEFEIAFALVMILCWVVTVIVTRADLKAVREDLIFLRRMAKKNEADLHEKTMAYTHQMDVMVETAIEDREEIRKLEDRIAKLEDALDELGKLDIPAQFSKLSDRILACEIAIDKAADEADGEKGDELYLLDPDQPYERDTEEAITI